MFFNGDRIYRDKEYYEFFNHLFIENVNTTQNILNIINKLPSKTLRSLLIKALQSNRGGRLIAKITEIKLKIA